MKEDINIIEEFRKNCILIQNSHTLVEVNVSFQENPIFIIIFTKKQETELIEKLESLKERDNFILDYKIK